MPKLKLSDGSWYPKIFDICNCERCNEIVWGGRKYINGHVAVGNKRPDFSEWLKNNNPMWLPEVIEMHSGENNVMKRPEVAAKFKGDLNPAKRLEVRQKLVDIWKDLEIREERCRKNSESWTPEKREEYSKRMKDVNPMSDPEVKKNHLESVNTVEYKENMSQLKKESWKIQPIVKNCGKFSYFYGKPPHHSQKVFPHLSPLQGEILMHRWDRKVAQYYDKNNIKYLYESKTFPIILNEKDCTYTPDFYLPESDTYIEVKGYWRGDAKDRYEEFKKQYPNIKIQLLIQVDLKKLDIDLKITPEESDIIKAHKKKRIS